MRVPLPAARTTATGAADWSASLASAFGRSAAEALVGLVIERRWQRPVEGLAPILARDESGKSSEFAESVGSSGHWAAGGSDRGPKDKGCRLGLLPRCRFEEKGFDHPRQNPPVGISPVEPHDEEKHRRFRRLFAGADAGRRHSGVAAGHGRRDLSGVGIAIDGPHFDPSANDKRELQTNFSRRVARATRTSEMGDVAFAAVDDMRGGLGIEATAPVQLVQTH